MDLVDIFRALRGIGWVEHAIKDKIERVELAKQCETAGIILNKQRHDFAACIHISHVTG